MTLIVILLIVNANAIGQTGPGGVFSNNVLWLSADRGVYNNAGTVLASNGDNVQQWNDRSGNAKHASEGNAANRPNYHTNVVNGLPIVRYTAANTDRLLAAGLTSANTASVWVVASYTSLPSNNPGLFQGSASGLAYSNNTADKNIGMWVNNTSRQPWGRGIQTNDAQLNIPQNTTTNIGNVYILNNSYGATTINQYVNNTAAGSVATNGTLKSWTDLAIGCQGGTESWNGDIAEVIAFNISLNNTQRLLVANYLAAKYGLALGTGDIYTQDNAGQGNYDHDVAGIGQASATDLSSDGQGSGIVRINNPSNLGNNEYMLWGHDNGALGPWGVTDLPTGVQGRWARVWRVSEVSATGNPVNVGAVDMTFDLTGLGPVTASHLRLLVDTDGDGLFADELPITGATSIGSNQYRFAGVTALTNNRRFTLGTTNLSSTPLPIELISFKGHVSGPSEVSIEWSTATEHNNDHFTVERSTDLVLWQHVATVNAVGNSTTLTEYAETDGGLTGGLYYYRLHQTDIDGTTTQADMIAVVLNPMDHAAPSLFPNPNSGVFQVQLPALSTGQVTFTLLDITGRSIARTVQDLGSGRYQFNADFPSPGVYQLHIQDGNTVKVCSVLVQ